MGDGNTGTTNAQMSGAAAGKGNTSINIGPRNRVGLRPFVSKTVCETLKNLFSLIAKQTISRYDKRCKVFALIQASIKVLGLFCNFILLENLVGISCDMGWGIKAHDADVNDAPNTAVKKTMNVEITACIGTKLGVSGNKGTRWVSRRVARGGRSGCRRWIDFRFRTNARGREGCASNIGKFIADIIVAKKDQATFLAAFGMLEACGLATTITCCWQIKRFKTISVAQIVTKSLSRVSILWFSRPSSFFL